MICSPRSANSEWVNKEIGDFLEIGEGKGVNNLEKVFPFIVEGTPHAKDASEECFPKILRDLPDEKERIGGNVNESGRDKAFVKVVAGMLSNVSMDTLWNRYERDKAEEERRKREERDKLLIAQSRYIAEKASDLVEDEQKWDPNTALRLLMEVMPKNLLEPDRPYTVETEKALRTIYHSLNPSLVNTILNRSGMVWAVSISPNGKYIASGSNDYTISIWDAETGCAIRTLSGHTGVVTSVAFSPDGKRIASSSLDISARIWDVETGQVIRILKGHQVAVGSADFSPDGKQLVTASDDKTVRIWDTETGDTLLVLEGHSAEVDDANFSPDGKRIVSASDDHTVRIWDAETGQCLHFLEGHDNEVNHAVFSPDGKYVASSSTDNTVRLWEAETGQLIRILEGHFNAATDVTFSPDGRHLISSSLDKTIRTWNIEEQAAFLRVTTGMSSALLSVPMEGASFPLRKTGP